MLSDDEVVERFAGLRQHQHEGKRSPHKPLLVLTALGRLLRTGASDSPFSEMESQLSSLIANFGPPPRTALASSVAYPFTRLRSDGVWELDENVPMDNVGPLRTHDVTGRFDSEIETALRSSPALVNRVARMLVDSQFPETLAGDVLLQAGLIPTTYSDPVTYRPTARHAPAAGHGSPKSWPPGIALAPSAGTTDNSATRSLALKLHMSGGLTLAVHPQSMPRAPRSKSLWCKEQSAYGGQSIGLRASWRRAAPAARHDAAEPGVSQLARPRGFQERTADRVSCSDQLASTRALVRFRDPQPLRSRQTRLDAARRPQMRL